MQVRRTLESAVRIVPAASAVALFLAVVLHVVTNSSLHAPDHAYAEEAGNAGIQHATPAAEAEWLSAVRPGPMTAASAEYLILEWDETSGAVDIEATVTSLTDPSVRHDWAHRTQAGRAKLGPFEVEPDQRYRAMVRAIGSDGESRETIWWDFSHVQVEAPSLEVTLHGLSPTSVNVTPDALTATFEDVRFSVPRHEVILRGTHVEPGVGYAAYRIRMQNASTSLSLLSDSTGMTESFIDSLSEPTFVGITSHDSQSVADAPQETPVYVQLVNLQSLRDEARIWTTRLDASIPTLTIEWPLNDVLDAGVIDSQLGTGETSLPEITELDLELTMSVVATPFVPVCESSGGDCDSFNFMTTNPLSIPITGDAGNRLLDGIANSGLRPYLSQQTMNAAAQEMIPGIDRQFVMEALNVCDVNILNPQWTIELCKRELLYLIEEETPDEVREGVLELTSHLVYGYAKNATDDAWQLAAPLGADFASAYGVEYPDAYPLYLASIKVIHDLEDEGIVSANGIATSIAPSLAQGGTSESYCLNPDGTRPRGHEAADCWQWVTVGASAIRFPDNYYWFWATVVAEKHLDSGGWGAPRDFLGVNRGDGHPGWVGTESYAWRSYAFMEDSQWTTQTNESYSHCSVRWTRDFLNDYIMVEDEATANVIQHGFAEHNRLEQRDGVEETVAPCDPYFPEVVDRQLWHGWIELHQQYTGTESGVAEMTATHQHFKTETNWTVVCGRPPYCAPVPTDGDAVGETPKPVPHEYAYYFCSQADRQSNSCR